MFQEFHHSVILRSTSALVALLLAACSAPAEREDAVASSTEALACAALSPQQAAILKFEDASRWTSTFATLSLSSTHTEGAHSLGVKPTSGYSTLTSAALSTLPLGGRSFTMSVRTPSPPVNPTWFGNVTAYLDAPSRGLSGVYLGYQNLATTSPGTFQTLNFEIPQYAYDALKAASYSDLTIRFGLALPEGSAPYLFDNLSFNLCPAATPVSACRQITTSGPYVLQSDLSTTSSDTACISIHDTQSVDFDCAGRKITGFYPIEVRNVQGFTIHNCNLRASQLLWVNVRDSSGGLMTANDIRSLDAHTSAVVDVASTSSSTFDNNTVIGVYQQSYSAGNTISNNRITAAPGADATTTTASALVGSNFGSQTKVINNILNGSWTGVLPPLWNTNGADDGVITHDEPGLVVQNNTISNVYDCGYEGVGVMTGATITGNRISNAGICGIGGWYYIGLSGSTVSNNTVDNAGDLLLFNRIGGLRPAGFDPLHRFPAETAIYFKDNVFDGNVLTNPNGYSLFGTFAASDVPVFDDLAYPPSWVGMPGETVAQHSDFKLTNNKFKNNNFGHTRAAPWFGNNAPVAGLIIDGGNNTCSAPTTAGYPIVCH